MALGKRPRAPSVSRSRSGSLQCARYIRAKIRLKFREQGASARVYDVHLLSALRSPSSAAAATSLPISDPTLSLPPFVCSPRLRTLNLRSYFAHIRRYIDIAYLSRRAHGDTHAHARLRLIRLASAVRIDEPSPSGDTRRAESRGTMAVSLSLSLSLSLSSIDSNSQKFPFGFCWLNPTGRPLVASVAA